LTGTTQGSAQIVTEPNSGIIYGANFSITGSNAAVCWAYDINTTTLLTNQILSSTQVDGSGIYYIVFPT
jgi:hypothetical protein